MLFFDFFPLFSIERLEKKKKSVIFYGVISFKEK